MNSKTINYLLILSLALLFTIFPRKSCADKNHLFYNDVKQAYQDFGLVYDSRIEKFLYSKLPEPDRELPEFNNAEENEKLFMVYTIGALHHQFFKKVKTGGQYCPPEKIKKYYGQSPKDRIGISSGGYYRLFVAYWTLKIRLEESRERNVSRYGYGKVYYVDSLLGFVESNLAGAFFPTPGPIQIPESTRRQAIQDLLDMYAPSMTINELYEGADPQKVRWPVLKVAEPSKFTHDKKLNLIRQLVKRRIENDPVLKEKYAGKGAPKVDDIPEMVLMGLPEGTIVSIVETYWMMKFKASSSDKEILELIELHRSTQVPNPEGTTMPSPLTVSNYIKYRLHIEHSHGVPISNEFVDECIKKAYEAYR